MPRRSLSARLLWLTVGIVLLTEVLIFVPSLGGDRQAWLDRHVREANIAVLAVAAAPGGQVDAATRHELLRLSGDALIRLETGGTALVLGQPGPLASSVRIDLRAESTLTGIWRALAGLFRSHDRLLELVAESPLRQGSVMHLVLHERALQKDLRLFAWHIAAASLLIAAVAGALVYFVLLALLVRPMRRITDSIAAFRADPERGAPLDPDRVSLLPDDEMALAGQELAAMQHELRAALWRNARLAALGAAVAKFSHDLRNILAPALLAADRLIRNPDADVARSGELLTQAIEQAIGLVRQALEFVREGPPPLARTVFCLRDLVDETAGTVAQSMPGLAMRNDIAPDLSLEADRMQLFRVLLNLLRNAAEAGAGTARIGASPDPAGVAIQVEDDGPGLPDAVRANLFRPFVGSGRRGGTGLGLAIARDLIRAHGGDIALVASGAGGTVFRLLLPAVQGSAQRASEPAQPEAAAERRA